MIFCRSIATCPFAPSTASTAVAIEAASTFSLGFAAAPDEDMRRYSQPQGDTLAMVFESTDGAPPDTRDLVVWPRSATVPIHRMSDRSEHMDPLTYALFFPHFFPHGTPGWHDRLLHAEQYRTPCYQRLTAGQFYTHRLGCLLSQRGDANELVSSKPSPCNSVAKPLRNYKLLHHPLQMSTTCLSNAAGLQFYLYTYLDELWVS